MEIGMTTLSGNALVNRSLREHIRPFLVEQGFTTFTQRTYWRHTPDRVDVVNFRSYNAYRAQLLGCTTFSFGVNLGIYFLAISPLGGTGSIKQRNNVLLPQEFECHFRHPLTRVGLDYNGPRSDIWFIDPHGINTVPVIQDAALALRRQAVPWFAHYGTPATALRTLLTNDEDFATVWGFGRNPSPARDYMTGYMALSLGNSNWRRYV
jgi:hypothetical protein